MKDEKQFDVLNKNFDELENEKKETLVSIGERLLDIQGLINTEKVSELEKSNLQSKNK